MSKTVLKPCPFCGDVDSVHLSTMLSCRSIYAVHCGHCGTYTSAHKRPEEATDAWNMRAPGEEGKALGNELKSCPFCGGSAEFVGLGGYTNQYSHVYIARIKCQTCHAYIRRFDSIYRHRPPVKDKEGLEELRNALKDDAIRFWNREKRDAP